MSQRLHKALSKVDLSFYTSSEVDETNRKDKASPLCLHQQPAKLVMVRKEGPNKVTHHIHLSLDWPGRSTT